MKVVVDGPFPLYHANIHKYGPEEKGRKEAEEQEQHSPDDHVAKLLNAGK